MTTSEIIATKIFYDAGKSFVFSHDKEEIEECILTAMRETVKECANRAKMKELHGSSHIVDKESILSLLKELK